MKKTIAIACSMVVGILMMVSTQGTISAQDNSDDSDDVDQIKSELSSKTVSFEFEDTQFREVINRIRQQVSFNIIISDKVDKLLGQDGGNADQEGNQAGEGNANNGFGENSGGSSGGFGSSDSGNSSGGFGSSGSGNDSGGFGSSGGDDSSGGFGNSSGGESGGSGSSGDSSSGGFGSSDSGGGFGSSGGDSSGGSGFGDSGGSSGFGNAGGGAGNQPANIDDKVTIKLDNVTIMRALKLILNQKNLTAVYKLGAVHIVPKDQAQSYNIQFYDVRDLQYKLEDFKSQVTRFHQTGGYTGKNSSEGGGGGGSSGEFLNNQMFGGGSGGDGKEIITNEKEFMKLIKGNVGSKQDWQGKASMRMTNGILVVNQTEEVHEDIDFLINRLRQFK